MFIEQLRCDDDVSELFQKERVFGPTESTMNSGRAGVVDVGHSALR